MDIKLTQAQVQEIAGRLNAVSVTGIANMQHILSVLALLEKASADQSNVVDMTDKANAG